MTIRDGVRRVPLAHTTRDELAGLVGTRRHIGRRAHSLTADHDDDLSLQLAFAQPRQHGAHAAPHDLLVQLRQLSHHGDLTVPDNHQHVAQQRLHAER
ncbi:hypothetical protein BH18ACT17_BH18ACT17_04330 [soil metagenome]